MKSKGLDDEAESEEGVKGLKDAGPGLGVMDPLPLPTAEVEPGVVRRGISMAWMNSVMML